MPDQAPLPGLYQQLLTEGLEQQLRDLQESLDATDRLIHWKPRACWWRVWHALPWST